MRRTGSARAIAVLLVLASGMTFAADDLEFFQTVDRTEVGTEDTFRLEVVMKNAPPEAELRLPALDDFEVLSKSPMSETSVQITNGRTQVQRITRYVLVLRAQRAGRSRIPPARLITDDKTHRTEGIQITVRQGSVGPAPDAQTQNQRRRPDPFRDFGPFGGFPDEKIPTTDSDLFLRTHVDETSVYVGEQVTMSVYVFSRVDLSSVDTVNLPRLEGFWSEDIDSPSQLSGEQRVINGIPYRAYLLKRKALFPTRAGTLKIDPVEADITTGYLFAGHRVHRKGNPVEIEVKPLPPGAPDNFSSTNVGRWRITAEAVPTRVKLGEPITFRVSVDGTGNLKNLSIPGLEAPASFRVYDPTTTDKVTHRGDELGGKRSQEYLVMPSQTGTFTLPTLRLPFFNPETGQYEVAETEALTIQVEPGAGGSAAVAQGSAPVPTATPEGPRNVLAATGLRPLRHEARFESGTTVLWREPWFIPAVLAPFGLWAALGLVGLLRNRFGREDPGAIERQQARAARKRLQAAETLKAEGSTEAFHAEVEKALVSFLEAKLKVSIVGLTRDALAERMAEAGISPALRQKIAAVLETCETGRFAPGLGDASARERILDDAEAAMAAWEEGR